MSQGPQTPPWSLLLLLKSADLLGACDGMHGCLGRAAAPRWSDRSRVLLPNKTGEGRQGRGMLQVVLWSAQQAAGHSRQLLPLDSSPVLPGARFSTSTCSTKAVGVV